MHGYVCMYAYKRKTETNSLIGVNNIKINILKDVCSYYLKILSIA